MPLTQYSFIFFFVSYFMVIVFPRKLYNPIELKCYKSRLSVNFTFIEKCITGCIRLKTFVIIRLCLIKGGFL